MRCPECQATNPEGAAFCGQCFTRFPPPEEPAQAPPPASPTPAPTSPTPAPASPTWDSAAPTSLPAGGPSAAPAPPATPAPAAAAGRFAVQGGEVTWRCAVCGTTQPFGQFTCTACGARIDAEPADAEPVDLEGARRAEALVPGLGHLRTGHAGMGWSRLAITAVWLAGSLLLASGGPSGLLTAAPLVLGMVVIWVTGPGDLAAAATGRTPRLDARRFMYLVIGATTGVIAAGGLAVIL